MRTARARWIERVGFSMVTSSSAPATAAAAAQVRTEGGFDFRAQVERALVGGAALAFGDGQVGFVEDPVAALLGGRSVKGQACWREPRQTTRNPRLP